VHAAIETPFDWNDQALADPRILVVGPKGSGKRQYLASLPYAQINWENRENIIGVVPAGAATGSSSPPHRPAAVIVSGACADPLSASSDGYFRKSMANFGNPAEFSPYAQIRVGLPPVLSIHATHDEYCSHDDMVRFVARYQESSNEATLVSVDGASHFFGFYHEPGKAQMRAAIAAAFERWGW